MSFRARSNRNFGSKTVSQTHNRTALKQLLTLRQKPLTDADKESLCRSYGVALPDIERIAKECGL